MRIGLNLVDFQTFARRAHVQCKTKFSTKFSMGGSGDDQGPDRHQISEDSCTVMLFDSHRGFSEKAVTAHVLLKQRTPAARYRSMR